MAPGAPTPSATALTGVVAEGFGGASAFRHPTAAIVVPIPMTAIRSRAPFKGVLRGLERLHHLRSTPFRGLLARLVWLSLDKVSLIHFRGLLEQPFIACLMSMKAALAMPIRPPRVSMRKLCHPMLASCPLSSPRDWHYGESVLAFVVPNIHPLRLALRNGQLPLRAATRRLRGNSPPCTFSARASG